MQVCGERIDEINRDMRDVVRVARRRQNLQCRGGQEITLQTRQGCTDRKGIECLNKRGDLRAPVISLNNDIDIFLANKVIEGLLALLIVVWLGNSTSEMYITSELPLHLPGMRSTPR